MMCPKCKSGNVYYKRPSTSRVKGSFTCGVCGYVFGFVEGVMQK